MADFLEMLKGAGHGALTGASMLAAVRQGRDPFALFTERDIRQQQLHDLEQASILKQAAALQDPAARAYLMQNPQAASAFGLPTETAVGASANFPVPSDLGTTPQTIQPQGQAQMARQMGVLPPQVETAGSMAIEANRQKQAYFQLLQGLMGGGGGQQPQMPMGGGVQPAAGGAPGRAPMRLQTIGPSGPSFGVTPTASVESGTINPATGQPFQAGELNPSGAPVLVKPTKMTQANQGQLGKVKAARAALSLFDTPIDVKTGQPNPNGVKPIDTLPSGESYGGIAALPGASSVIGTATTYKARKGDAAAAFVSAGGVGRTAIVKALGDVGNLNEQEQRIVEERLLPSKGDTRELARLKMQAAERILSAIEQGLTNGTMQEGQVKDFILTQGAGTAEPPPGAAAPSPAPTEGASGGTGFDAMNKKRESLGLPPIQARAKGGSTKKGNLTLVGENGPELARSASPMTIQPLQLAQNTPWSPQPSQQPMQLQAPVQQAPMLGGLTQGQGLSDADIQRARQGYTVIMGPNGPVAVPR